MNIKVGDLVQITKSKKNWNTLMDKFVGRIVQVTRVYRSSYGYGIKFKGNGCWTWCYEEGHFQPIKNQIIEIW